MKNKQNSQNPFLFGTGAGVCVGGEGGILPGGTNFRFPGSSFSRTELRPLKTTKMEPILIIFNYQKPSTFFPKSFV